MSYYGNRNQQTDPRQTKIVEAVINNNVNGLKSIIQGMKPNEYTGSNYAFPRNLFCDDPTNSSGNNNYGLSLPINQLTLLHIAAYCDSLEVFIFLCNLHKDKFNTRTASAASYHPLHYACCSAAYEVAFYILSIDPAEAAQTPSVDWHFIYLASEAGDPEILNLIFANGADINAEPNKRNNSINQAIKKKNIECLRILIQKGSKETKDQRNYTPLMLAITNNQFEAVPILLDSGENPEYFAPDGKSALFLACFQRSVETVRLLCEKMQVVDLDPNQNGMGLIHYACMSNNPEIIRIVLTKNINVNRFDKDGKLGPTNLVYCPDEKVVIQIMEMLVEKGFNLNKVATFGGKPTESLLMTFVSTIKKMYTVIDWMLTNGADPYMKAKDQKQTIVEYVQSRSDKKMKDVFAKHVKMTK
ncbi:ankyrin repeat protein [Histomonas meleagridis]|uniref:ankyrin repeat protein n=1 Tax=Histomonas meleagridis TaxID=135588 RepID=UPI00355A0B9F|nr:ankyrin repeat protein [Histomonas meleagridis]KAH0801585.1 ankyrin repeat protein [Histomonas meleagridis]